MKKLIALLVIAILLNIVNPSVSYTKDVSSRKNLILIIGDGMQKEHEVAASRYLNGKDFGLKWHSFPYQNHVTTWNINTYNAYAEKNGQPDYSKEDFSSKMGYNPKQGGTKPYPLEIVPSESYFLDEIMNLDVSPDRIIPATDSASAATAMASGQKTVFAHINWQPGDLPNGKITNIVDYLRQYTGKSIGIITTVPFNHATPAGFSTHNTSRYNYYKNENGFQGPSLAEEIIFETQPEVVIGGGHPHYSDKYLNKTTYNKLKNLNDYILAERKPLRSGTYSIISSAYKAIDSGKKLFGLYGGKSGNFDVSLPTNSPGKPQFKKQSIENPTLSDSLTAALNVLSQDEDGFFLLVEQGDIDWANHNNNYKNLIGTMNDLNEAVKALMNYMADNRNGVNLDNTLVILTSDHANSYMRLNKELPLVEGELPKQKRNIHGKWVYPDHKVSYKTKEHTNELVSVYAIGKDHSIFELFEGCHYSDNKLLDNTDIFNVMAKYFSIPR